MKQFRFSRLRLRNFLTSLCPVNDMTQPHSVAPRPSATQTAGSAQQRRRRAGVARNSGLGRCSASPTFFSGCIPLAPASARPKPPRSSRAVGPNRIDTAKPKGLMLAFVERLGNPLVAILLFAAAVSALTGDVPSFVVIAVIVLMSVILDVTQERQAQNAAERLRERVSLSVKALRDGQPVDIPAAEIVPGDVFLLAAGDLIPADSRLIEARDLYVDEALLTGEAYPAEKEAALPAGCAQRETALPH